MKQVVQRLGLLAIVAVAGLTVTTLATFATAVAKTVNVAAALLRGGWRDDLAIVDLLEVIDTYLLAIVQLIVVIGLYELFVGQLVVPDWLRARSLDDLKKSIVDVLIVFIGVKGIEALLARDDPRDALAFTAAVAILIVALSLFRVLRSSPPKEGQTPSPGDRERSTPVL